jgi:hypothetical protein
LLVEFFESRSRRLDFTVEDYSDLKVSRSYIYTCLSAVIAGLVLGLKKQVELKPELRVGGKPEKKARAFSECRIQ